MTVCRARWLTVVSLTLWGAVPTVVAAQDSAHAPGPVPTARADSARDALGPDRVGVRVCAGGDITLGTNLDTTWVRRMTWQLPSSVPAGDTMRLSRLARPDSLVKPLRALVSDAAIVLINAEAAIGDGPVEDPKCVSGRAQCFSLRSAAAAAPALRTIADAPTVVVANVANNHTGDAGATGLAATVALLDSAGLLVTGADTEPTIAVTPTGDSIAILGFSAWSGPGVGEVETVRRLVSRAAARFRRVIVTAHLGAEGRHAQRTRDSLEEFAGEKRGNPIAFAHAAVDAGAGLVVGHGPHVLRAAEWRHGALIFYSLGNLVNYGPFKLGEPMDRGAIACATLDSAGRPHDVVLNATRQPDLGVVRTDPRRRALVLVDSLSRIDFPSTGARVDRITGVVTTRVSDSLSRPRHDR